MTEENNDINARLPAAINAGKLDKILEVAGEKTPLQIMEDTGILGGARLYSCSDSLNQLLSDLNSLEDSPKNTPRYRNAKTSVIAYLGKLSEWKMAKVISHVNREDRVFAGMYEDKHPIQAFLAIRDYCDKKEGAIQ